MKVLIKVDTTIGGVRYLVNPGEQLPEGLALYWTASHAIDSMIACGVIESPVSKYEATPQRNIKTESKKDYNKK